MSISLKSILFATIPLTLLLGCGNNTESKFDPVTNEVRTDTVNDLRADQAEADSLELVTRPRTVLITGLPQYRLTPILKRNWDTDHRTTFFGDIEYRSGYGEAQIGMNDWHSHIVPGYEAACGYNIVNVSHFDTQTRQQRTLFDSLVLIKTLYYPSTETDTLDSKTVQRDSYIVSVFDEDTNHDGYINQNDLRRFYHFALPTLEKTPLVPKNHTVLSAEYDPKNDWMFTFTRQDNNQNGKLDPTDPWHIFWIDMKNPKNNGQML